MTGHYKSIINQNYQVWDFMPLKTCSQNAGTKQNSNSQLWRLFSQNQQNWRWNKAVLSLKADQDCMYGGTWHAQQKKICDALFSSYQSRPRHTCRRVWRGASAYGPAPKHIGREGMPDGPPCLWGFDSDFQTHFVRKRVKLSEQNVWF